MKDFIDSANVSSVLLGNCLFSVLGLELLVINYNYLLLLLIQAVCLS